VQALMILNDAPYGTERCHNAVRLAHAPLKNEAQAQVTVFLMADSVAAAKKGHYNLERMLKRVAAAKGSVLLCGSVWMRAV